MFNPIGWMNTFLPDIQLYMHNENEEFKVGQYYIVLCYMENVHMKTMDVYSSSMIMEMIYGTLIMCVDSPNIIMVML